MVCEKLYYIEIFSFPLIILSAATVRLLDTDPIPEGAAGEICVIIESLNSETLGFDVLVALSIADITAGV